MGDLMSIADDVLLSVCAHSASAIQNYDDDDDDDCMEAMMVNILFQ